MPVLRFLRAYVHKAIGLIEQQKLLRSVEPSHVQSIVMDWTKSLRDPSGYYRACFQYFHTELSSDLCAHRRYFTVDQRGFGEDAFHVMWEMIFKRFRPSEFLEIGVYRGQTLSLASLLQKRLGIFGTVAGISPFQSVGDSVSVYKEKVNYLDDTRQNFAHFGLPMPALIQEYSTSEAAVRSIESREWDCIYIDGNHDYEVAKLDWTNCAKAVKCGGLIILDDSALSTAYRPPHFATGGHAGPSRVASEIDSSHFREVLQVGHNRVFQRIK